MSSLLNRICPGFPQNNQVFSQDLRDEARSVVVAGQELQVLSGDIYEDWTGSLVVTQSAE